MSRAIAIFIFVVVSASAISLLWSDTPASSWMYTEVVSLDSDYSSFLPSMAVEADGTVHIAWGDAYPFSPDFDGIFYSCKPVGGYWETTEKVSTESIGGVWSEPFPSTPSLALGTDGTVHIVWSDPTDYDGAGPDCDIFYKCKPSGGVWTPTEVVSVTSSDTSGAPSLAVEPDGTLHVTWFETDALDNKTLFYQYRSPGSDWSAAEPIVSGNLIAIHTPPLAVDSMGTAHVTWSEYISDPEDCDIYYSHRPKYGTWETAELVSAESDDNSYGSSLFLDADLTVHVVWSDSTDYENCGTDFDIFYKKKTAGGSWTTTEVASKYSDEDSKYPCMLVDPDGLVHLLYQENSFGGMSPKIYYKYRLTSGYWINEEMVSTESTLSCYIPVLAMDGEKTLHASWADTTPYGDPVADEDICYKKKPVAGGMLWADCFEVSAAPGGTSNFSLDVGRLNGDRWYLVLGGKSGTSPGIWLPGHKKKLPLNWDSITDFIAQNLNTLAFTNFLGVLDSNGKAAAQLNLRPGLLNLIGTRFYFAFTCDEPWDIASNAIWVEVVP